jgi:hypothetical protein
MTRLSRLASLRLTALHNSRCLVPGDLHLHRDSHNCGNLEPRDRQRLKQRSEPTSWFRPRNSRLKNAMLLTVYPGNVGLNHCDKSTGVEVSPLTASMIVGWTFLVTLRVSESPFQFMGQSHCDLHFGHFEIHLPHASGSSQIEQLFVKFFVLHSVRVSCPLRFFTLPTQKSEAP